MLVKGWKGLKQTPLIWLNEATAANMRLLCRNAVLVQNFGEKMSVLRAAGTTTLSFLHTDLWGSKRSIHLGCMGACVLSCINAPCPMAGFSLRGLSLVPEFWAQNSLMRPSRNSQFSVWLFLSIIKVTTHSNIEMQSSNIAPLDSKMVSQAPLRPLVNRGAAGFLPLANQRGAGSARTETCPARATRPDAGGSRRRG